MIRSIFLAIALLLPLAACDDEQDTKLPAPTEVGSEDAGYFCGMLVGDHAGPKGQIHLASVMGTIWFTSVRDAVAFTRMPDEPHDILAFYVNDMGKAASWAVPGPGTWILADNAFYVIGSEMKGGMGQPEAVPFGEESQAKRFAAEHGGKVMRLADIPDTEVLSPTDRPTKPGMAGMGQNAKEGMSHATQ